MKDATARQAAPGWFAAAAMSRSEDRAGLSCSWACAGERGSAVLFLPFFIQRNGWLLHVEGKESSAVLVSSLQGGVQEGQILHSAVSGVLTLCSRRASALFKAHPPRPLLDTQQRNTHNLCFPVSLSHCDSGNSDAIFLRLEVFFSWHEFSLLFAIAVAVRLWPLLRAEPSISPQLIHHRHFT